ncbi:isopenicillin N synthase family dioxygenase [Paraburkholderia megapolitana]|uniref:2-oxoglutarate-dependent ethylene/succinate-forming enzyme n=1 Tax=Paraburkholderia megapolitana TaxID=420953 RepID=A0A1I3T510_9BURK|nr:2-oxoglutarate and iron-dependent oxygenase domain-containing protein [Paraburkholderia megapolitana]SFJ64587.1 Isopenicillin N synthase [Paraburkholderia megapolitana]
MSSATRIPIIDLAGLRAGDPAALARVGREIYDACTTIGFFYVVNHGVPQLVIDTAEAGASTFFSFSTEMKRRVAVNARHRGFNALGDATMYQAKRPDYKEFFSIGLELPEADPDVIAGQPLRGPNNWPDFMPALRIMLYPYYEALAVCGADLLRAVAVGLGIDEHFFASRYTKRMQRTQMVYYPTQPPQSGEDQFGVAPHTDYGCITLLWQDQVGGLQVREIANDTWIDAPPIPGSFVVNVGDLLARWTNDRFRSTLHRVINTSGRERYSIATFYDPTYGASVDPRELGTAEANLRYQPIAAGDYILGRINDSMGYRKKLAEGSAT